MDSISGIEDITLNRTSHVTYPMEEAFLDAGDDLVQRLSDSQRILLDPGRAMATWSLATGTLAILVSFLLAWRLWNFVVRPWLNPDEPKEIPYWTPCKSWIEKKMLVTTNGDQRPRYRPPMPQLLTTNEYRLNICNPGHTLSFFQNPHALIARSR